MNLKRLFLYSLIGSVAVSAMIGIAVMIFGNFGEFETKVLLTTMTMTITSILGLACGACFEAGKGRAIPAAGIVSAVVSAILWMIMIWSRFDPDNDFFVHCVLTATLLAISCSLISLLLLARLDARFDWSRYLAHTSVWSLTAILILIIWAEIDPSDSWIARTLGVLSIIVAAVSVVTPVFHFLSSSQRSVEDIDSEIAKLRARIEMLETERVDISHTAK